MLPKPPAIPASCGSEFHKRALLNKTFYLCKESAHFLLIFRESRVPVQSHRAGIECTDVSIRQLPLKHEALKPQKHS